MQLLLKRSCIIMRKPFMVEFSGTPEAGKTTTIRTVANMLRAKEYTVEVLTESAEILPNEITKGSWDANLWMHYHTQAGILRSLYLDKDIILINRGLIDSKFYGVKFLTEGLIGKEQYNIFCKQFLKELYPDLFIGLTVNADTSIQRRGGEGRLVNREYVERYNRIFKKYYNEEVKQKKVLLDTTSLDVYEMNQKVFEVIEQKLP